MHNEGNYKQGEKTAFRKKKKKKTAFRMGDNNNKATVKELISKMYKQLMQLNTRKINKSKNLTDISLKNICRWLTNT